MARPRDVTPAMEQFLRFKDEHRDAVLLFRMGDFYETFYDDAKEVSGLLGLTLTSRNNGRGGESVPMAGVPHHALDTYLARLIKAGRKVAICEQMEPPQKGKAVVRREVVQVVSPGTALSDNLLDQNRNNYLLGLWVESNRLGAAVTDLSTGDFRTLERDVDDLWEVLERIGPAEVLAPESWAEANEGAMAYRMPGTLLVRAEEWHFGFAYAHDLLLEHFRVNSLKGFGCDQMTVGISAAGAVLGYLKQNQKGSVSHITRLSREYEGAYMGLDLVTQRNLELITSIQEGRREGTLLSLLDRTCTAMGARTLRSWLSQPLMDISGIDARQDAVEDLIQHPARRESVRSALKQVGDLERLMSRICCGRCSPRDLVALKVSLQAIPGLRDTLNETTADLLVKARCQGMPDLSDLIDLIGRTVVDEPPFQLSEGGIIREGYNGELDELRDAASGGRRWWLNCRPKRGSVPAFRRSRSGTTRRSGIILKLQRRIWIRLRMTTCASRPW